MVILVLTVGIVSNSNYNAIYYTSSQYSEIDTKSLEENKIMKVNLLEDLKDNVDKIGYKVGIIVDKSILENSDKIDELSQWLKTKREYPIIVTGYSNPTYVFFKKILLSTEEYIPPISEEKYMEFSQEKGYSFAFIDSDEVVYGNGYKGDIDVDKICELINRSLKENVNIDEIIEESNLNEWILCRK